VAGPQCSARAGSGQSARGSALPGRVRAGDGARAGVRHGAGGQQALEQRVTQRVPFTQRVKQLQAQRGGKQVPALPARDTGEAGRRLGSHLPHSKYIRTVTYGDSLSGFMGAASGDAWLQPLGIYGQSRGTYLVEAQLTQLRHAGRLGQRWKQRTERGRRGGGGGGRGRHRARGR
jgi:hypothetical protein